MAVSQPSTQKVEDASFRRANFLRIAIVTSLVVPVVSDFFFFGTSVARYSRIFLFLSIACVVLINYKLFLSNDIVGMGSIGLVTTLFLLGTVVAVMKGGVATPNFLLLLLMVFVVAANFDLYEKALDSIGTAVFLLLILSAVVILLGLNPFNAFYTDKGYPVFLDFLGIPGRNYGVFAHPNSLGQISAISVAFIVCSRYSKFYLLLPFFCLIKCGSRTSLISTALILMLVAFQRILTTGRKKSRISMEQRYATISILVVVFLVLSSLVVEYVAFIDSTGLTGRVSIWQSALELVRGSSLLGLGWDWETRAMESQLLNIWAVSAHNAFFEMGFATGIIGLCIFLFMYAKIFAYFGVLKYREKLLVLVILISGVTESYFSLQYPNVMTLLMIVVVVFCHKSRLPA